MIDRQTLKYKGGRVCPLPPPSAKPLYDCRAFKRKINIAEGSANRDGTNWRYIVTFKLIIMFECFYYDILI
jgi:hypothetical protein